MTIKNHEPYRSRERITYEILQSMKAFEPGGIHKLELVYYNRLSSYQLRIYLEYLLEHDLIYEDLSTGHVTAKHGTRRGDVYHITQNGEKFIEIYNMQKTLGVQI